MLRRAVPADARAVAEVQLRGWWHAYGDLVDHELLAEHTVESRTERWASILAAGERDPTTLVVDAGGRVAGFTAFGAARSADAAPGLGEVWAIYVDPPAQGAGVGSALLAHAVGWLREAGFRAALLWTFEANGAARAFYEHHGWRLVEGDPQHADRWAPEVRYRRDL
jgi:GNAT superfamily N-acetyltransferase